MTQRLSALAVALASALLLAASSAPPPPYGDADGPLHTAQQLRAFEVEGVHLQMPLPDAEAALAVAGFKLLRVERTERAYLTRGWAIDLYDVFEREAPRARVTLGAVKLGRGPAKVIDIELEQEWPAEAGNQMDAQRSMILARYGPASHTTNYGPSVPTEHYAFVSQAPLRDSTTRSNVWSCTIDWQCDWLQEGRDCRKVLAANAVPTLEIELEPYRTTYLWRDYATASQALLRAPAFRTLDTGDRRCQLIIDE